MQTLKIILGVLVSIVMTIISIPTLIGDIKNNSDYPILWGDTFVIILFGTVIYYLFSTRTKSCKKSQTIQSRSDYK